VTTKDCTLGDTCLLSVEQYAKKMLSEAAYGGGIELLCFSRYRRTNVHVYRVRWRHFHRNSDALTPTVSQMCSMGRGFRRISMFNVEGAEHTVSMVLWDGSHYDFLWLKDGTGNAKY
jgi:hypothetical protein